MTWADTFRRKQREIGIDYLISADGFKCLDEQGNITSITWDDVLWVKIITTNKEHDHDEDLYWSFANADSDYIIPNCKDINGIFASLPQKFQGFDTDTMQEAMASHGEKTYTCWQR